ncbi:MAG TPA: protein-disulfide reductase DsbD domain-containing protein, partial [Rhodanobacteraceae bacterium]
MSSKLVRRALWLLLLALPAAQAAPELLQATEAFRLGARIAAPGKLQLHWNIAPHYYLYRGRIHVTSLDANARIGALLLPDGVKEHDPYLGDVEIYHNALDASVPYSIVPAAPANLRVAVTFQGCHEVEPKICYPPITQNFSVPLSGTEAGAISLPDSGAGPRHVALHPLQAPRQTDSAAVTSRAAIAATTPSSSPTSNLPLVLLLAFVGGLILNLMPCVLPVLAIKAIGLLESAESQARARRHASAYTAGVLASFLTIGLCILALRSAGSALGWGTQLQQPLLVAVLACVVF